MRTGDGSLLTSRARVATCFLGRRRCHFQPCGQWIPPRTKRVIIQGGRDRPAKHYHINHYTDALGHRIPVPETPKRMET
jgi:hypothetical protein